MTAAAPERLHRELGLAQVTASGVGIIIGAGIYVLLGTAAGRAGPAVWLSFVVAGALSALTALSYAELAAMFPSAGGEFEYARKVAPAWVAFLVGWVMVAGLVVAGAAVALGFASYLGHLVPVPQRAGALLLLVLVGAIALRGIRQSAAVTVALSLVQVGGLVLVAAIGLPHLGDHALLAGSTAGGVVGGAALVFFAFIGFDEVITLSDEAHDPSRTVPRALLVALAVSTALYALVALAGVSVLGADGLAASAQPLADVMASALGTASGRVVAVIALVATANTTLLVVTASSRLLYGMAARAALPPRFEHLSPRGVPVAGVAVALGGAALGVAIGDLTLVASVTDFAVYLVFVAVNAAVIILRFRQPHRLRPFRVRGTIGRVPIPAVLALVVVAVLVPGLDPAAIALGTVLVAIGLAVHLALRRCAPIPDRPVAPWGAGEEDGVRRRRVTPEEASAVLDLLRIDEAIVAWDLEQFRRGLHAELEHGRVDPDTNVTDDDLLVTAKIVLAHLNDIPDYYARLAAMEAEAHAEQERRSH